VRYKQYKNKFYEQQHWKNFGLCSHSIGGIDINQFLGRFSGLDLGKISPWIYHCFGDLSRAASTQQTNRWWIYSLVGYRYCSHTGCTRCRLDVPRPFRISHYNSTNYRCYCLGLLQMGKDIWKFLINKQTNQISFMFYMELVFFINFFLIVDAIFYFFK